MAKLSPLESEMAIPLLRMKGGYHDLVHPTLEAHSIADVLAYHHEVIHDEIFRTTKFGFVQLMFKSLAEQAVDPVLKRNAASVSTALFGSSVTVHEAAATYLSVKALPGPLQAPMADMYPSPYQTFYAALASIVDPVFASSRVQGILGRVVCRLALGGRIILEAAQWDGSARLPIEDALTPNKQLDSIADARPFAKVAIQEHYRRLAIAAGLDLLLDDIDDWNAWQQMDLRPIDTVDAIIYEACMHAALASDSVTHLMRWQEDAQHAAAVVRRFETFLPDFKPPMHYVYDSSMSDELKGLGEPFAFSGYRAEANARFVSEYNIDKSRLDGLIDLPLLPETGRTPAVLIADRRTPGDGYGVWSFYEHPLDGSFTCKRVGEKAVARLFDARIRMSQTGMPVASNIFFVVVGSLEAFRTDVTEYDFLAKLHKFIGNPKASFALHNVFVYMSGDLLLWLLQITTMGAAGSALIYPGELQEVLAEAAAIKNLADKENFEEKLITRSTELKLTTFALVLSLKTGATFFRIFPIHSFATISLFVSTLMMSGQMPPMDQSKCPLLQNWDVVNSVVHTAWPEL